MTLYHLNNQYLELIEMSENPDCDITLIADTLEAIEGEIEQKADACGIVLKELDGDREKVKNEIERLTGIVRQIDRAEKAIKASLLISMNLMGKTKFKTEHFKFSIAKNGGLPPVEITGEIPDEFKKYKVETDTKKIRESLAAGEELDFAKFGEKGSHLNIR